MPGVHILVGEKQQRWLVLDEWRVNHYFNAHSNKNRTIEGVDDRAVYDDSMDVYAPLLKERLKPDPKGRS